MESNFLICINLLESASYYSIETSLLLGEAGKQQIFSKTVLPYSQRDCEL